MTTTINLHAYVALLNSQETMEGKPKGYANLTTSQIDTSITKDFNTVFTKLSGTELAQDHSLVSVRFDEDGFFERTYPASLVNNNGSVALHLGKELVDIKFDHTDLNFQVTTYKFDRYDELVLSVYDDEADIMLPLPVRLSDEARDTMLETNKDGSKQLNYMKLSAAVAKGKYQALLDVLKEGKAGGSSLDIEPITQFAEPKVRYLVEKIKEIDVKYNGVPAKSYILNLLVDGALRACWLPSNIKQSAELGLIEEGKTFISYTASPSKDGKKTYIKGQIWRSGESSVKATLPQTEAPKAITATVEVKATEVVEEAIEAPVDNIVKSELPFQSRVESVSWIMEKLPHYSEAEALELTTKYKDEELVDFVNSEAVVPF